MSQTKRSMYCIIFFIIIIFIILIFFFIDATNFTKFSEEFFLKSACWRNLVPKHNFISKNLAFGNQNSQSEQFSCQFCCAICMGVLINELRYHQ